MITNGLVARSCMAYQRCFSHITSRQRSQASSDSSSYDSKVHHLWKFFMHVMSLVINGSATSMWYFCQSCDVLASVLWMFSIIINIHNIQPIHNGSMAFTLFIALNNSLATNMIQNDVLQQG